MKLSDWLNLPIYCCWLMQLMAHDFELCVPFNVVGVSRPRKVTRFANAAKMAVAQASAKVSRLFDFSLALLSAFPLHINYLILPSVIDASPRFFTMLCIFL